MNNDDSSNSIFDQVLSFIDYTNQNIFLTGKAGTGKTTLLKKIKETTTKKMVVLAPTGVAAMNAKGTTINSFFQLPPGSFFPGDISIENLQAGFLSIKSMVSDLSYSREKMNLFKELELLVIDEVSMVRCDLLDVIDGILKAVRRTNMPFGGVQLLLIGDLYQLPPVTKREDWAFLKSVYASPYFFDSHVLYHNPLLQIELTKVFRQTEPEFIKILNDIRNNQIDESGLSLLNKRHQPSFVSSEELNPIIITSHNAEANIINKEKLAELPGKEYTFEGEISGEFRELNAQAEQTLKLKEGAQVMFIKNDTGEHRKFFNGKIGKVKSITNGEIYITFSQDDDLLLEKTSWQSFEYKTDPDEAIVQQQVGEFSQYPIKLAWAVTIHKSQGLTFDHAIIDAGKSFIAGQVYVALSRVRTLNGLILKSKISTDSLRSNAEVINFMKPVPIAQLGSILFLEQEKYILQLVLNYFSFYSILLGLEPINSNQDVMNSLTAESKTLFMQIKKSVNDLLLLSDRFQLQVKQLHKQSSFAEQEKLHARIQSALTYFTKELTVLLLNPVNKNIRIKPKTKVQQQAQQLFLKFRGVIEHRISLMQYAADLLSQPIKKEDYINWITAHKEKSKVKSSPAMGNQSSINMQLF